MSPALHVVLLGTLSFGVPLAIAIREVIVTRRGGDGGSWQGDAPVPAPLPLLPDGGDGLPPLPACLDPAIFMPALDRSRRAVPEAV